MEEMQAAVNTIMTPAIELWVNWMLVIFLASVLFVYHYKSARIILLVFVLTLPLAIGIYKLFYSVYLLGLSHIILWTPLAIYLFMTEFKTGRTRPGSVYGVYLVLLLATISISLVLDTRDTVMVFMGMKV